jgi:hypothetical protein
MYSSGFSVPTEPRPWTRVERALMAVGVILLLVGLGYGVVLLASRGQSEDPALNNQPVSESPSE